MSYSKISRSHANSCVNELNSRVLLQDLKITWIRVWSWDLGATPRSQDHTRIHHAGIHAGIRVRSWDLGVAHLGVLWISHVMSHVSMCVAHLEIFSTATHMISHTHARLEISLECKFICVAHPHEKLLGILRVSIPATRKDLDDRTWGGFGTNQK